MRAEDIEVVVLGQQRRPGLGGIRADGGLRELIHACRFSRLADGIGGQELPRLRCERQIGAHTPGREVPHAVRILTVLSSLFALLSLATPVYVGAMVLGILITSAPPFIRKRREAPRRSLAPIYRNTPAYMARISPLRLTEIVAHGAAAAGSDAQPRLFGGVV